MPEIREMSNPTLWQNILHPVKWFKSLCRRYYLWRFKRGVKGLTQWAETTLSNSDLDPATLERARSLNLYMQLYGLTPEEMRRTEEQK